VSRRRAALALAIAIAVGVILGAAIIGGVDRAAAAPPVQQTALDLRLFLERTLQADLDDREVVVTEDLHYPTSIAEAYFDPPIIKIRPRMERAIARDIDTHGYRGWSQALHDLTHELLHRDATAACQAPDAAGTRHDEEGIVDLLANDLDPAVTRRFIGYPLEPVYTYSFETADVRAAIMRVGDGKPWSRYERLVLRKLWAADCAGRVAILEGHVAFR